MLLIQLKDKNHNSQQKNYKIITILSYLRKSSTDDLSMNPIDNREILKMCDSDLVSSINIFNLDSFIYDNKALFNISSA